MTTEPEYKSVKLDDIHVKAEGDARTFEGYASVFHHRDHDGDIVVPGAFKQSLATRGLPRSLYQHNVKQVPSVIRHAEEDAKGLLVRGEFIDSTLGRDVYAEVKSGGIDQFSIGYTVKKSRLDREKNARLLEQVDLFEVSWVTFPANDHARVTRVKQKPADERALEEYLREAGYSRAEAKAVVAKGYKGLSARREAEDRFIDIINRLNA